MIYNFVNPDGKAGVKVQSYVDYGNNNHWKSLQNFTDTGGWGRDGQDCKGNPRSDLILGRSSDLPFAGILQKMWISRI